jgi:hypothetical protein
MSKKLLRKEATMDIKHKFMFRALLGMLLGMIMGIIMYVLFTPDDVVMDKTYFLFHMLGSCIMGLIGYGGAIVYEFENWPLLRATFTHYIISFLTLFMISEFLGWFDHSILFVVFIIFTIIYVAIWLTEYLLWKKEINEINKELEVMLKKVEKDYGRY